MTDHVHFHDSDDSYQIVLNLKCFKMLIHTLKIKLAHEKALFTNGWWVSMVQFPSFKQGILKEKLM